MIYTLNTTAMETARIAIGLSKTALAAELGISRVRLHQLYAGDQVGFKAEVGIRRFFREAADQLLDQVTPTCTDHLMQEFDTVFA